MKRFFKSPALITATGLCSLLLSTAASADYRVTAFGYSAEYEAMLAGDVTAASSILSDRSIARMDFVEANNLCVTEILAKNYESAETACAAALEKVTTDFSVDLIARKNAKAAILSNMAVALAQSGELAAASAALEEALALNSRDKNAVANYSLIAEKLPSADLAQSF